MNTEGYNNYSDLSQRKVPFSLEAEQSVLGSILIDPRAIEDVAGIISSTDFYIDDHAKIYLAMNEMFISNRTIDLVTLIDTLTKQGVLKDRDISDYIKIIAQIVPSAKNIKDYANIVRDNSLLRQLLSAAQEVEDTVLTEKYDDVTDVLRASADRFFRLIQGSETSDFKHIKDVLVSSLTGLRQLSQSDEGATGTKTGYSDLDRVLVGMGAGDLVLIGARPGMGKTSFALNIASQVSLSNPDKAVCVFSLEMSAEQLVLRLLSSEALVDSYALRSGKIEKDDWVKLTHAAETLSKCNIYIDDTSGMSVSKVKAKLRKIENLGLVVIDYLQLMQSDKKIDNRVQEVSDISRNLKLLAKELEIPVVCCAQLSRGAEQRKDSKPMLSDLRDSGAIEQDADVVMFLHRDYYNTEQTEEQNLAEVIVAKNRHGSTDSVKMKWIGKYTKFLTLQRDEI
ncbi:MAG: replicative DNA helicase [Ruminococcaceae bacterium]|nr:replicative DNA helicase [Oscillospiraceae bacterium]